MNNEKGFTLIELLAVIVILAIIALIAVPIVLNIIKDAKEESNKRSIDNYGRAITNAILKNELNGRTQSGNYITDDGRVLTLKDDESKELNVEYDGETVKCDTIKITEEGKVYLAECSIGESTSKIDYTYGKNPTICTAVTESTTGNVPQGNYQPGDEYACEVAEGINYKFFVISSDTTNVNLIMYTNINSDGLPVENDSLNKGITVYNKSGDSKIGGPVDAVKYLNDATINWSNLTNLTGSYNDEGGNFTDFILTGKARLPYLSEISNYDSTNKTNLYLYDYVVSSAGIPKNQALGIAGYWLFSSDTDNSTFARFVNFNGIIGKFSVSSSSLGPGSLGVRPVITVLKSQLG